MAGFTQKEPGRSKRIKNRIDHVRSPRQVEDYWRIYRKGVYLEKPVRQGPAWLIPLLAFLLIVFLVFFAFPTVIRRVQSQQLTEEQTEITQVETIYQKAIQTVSVPVADVYEKPDIKSLRLTQLLYNQPILVHQSDDLYGFQKIELENGDKGYIMADQLTDQRASIEPAYHEWKLIVASPTKRIMSHASRGTLTAEVMMGTTLYADYQGDSIYRVSLPDGNQGWISAVGLIILTPEDRIEKPEDAGRYFINTLLEFNNTTKLDNGLTIRGASVHGAAAVAARINGLFLPVSFTEQLQTGRPVSITNGGQLTQSDIDRLQIGDLIFFSEIDQVDQAFSQGIYIGEQQVLYAGRSDTALMLRDLSRIDKPVYQVRRFIE